MSEFTKVAETNEIADPDKIAIKLADRSLVLIHADGKYRCLEEIQTDDGGTLADGKLAGNFITCSKDKVQFDIRNGRMTSRPKSRDTQVHSVEVRDDGVYVQISSDVTNALNSSTAMLPDTPDQGKPAELNPASEVVNPMTNSAEPLDFTSLSEDVIREQLKKVIDPELFVNIVDLGLIYAVELQEIEDEQTNVTIEMTMTSPACPAGPQLVANSKQVISQLKGVGDVEVKIVMEPPWSPDKMTDDAKDQLGIF